MVVAQDHVTRRQNTLKPLPDAYQAGTLSCSFFHSNQQKHLLFRQSTCDFLGFGLIPGLGYDHTRGKISLSATLHFDIARFLLTQILDPRRLWMKKRSSLRRRISCFGTLPKFLFGDEEVNLTIFLHSFFYFCRTPAAAESR